MTHLKHLRASAGWLPWFEFPAYLLDQYRTIPRLVLFATAAMTWRVTEWFMALSDPTTQQATFVSVAYGVVPLILNFYMQNGVDWERRRTGTATPPAAPAQQSLSVTATTPAAAAAVPVKGG